MSATSRAIRHLLQSYREQPLLDLREVNLQARLRQLMLDELDPADRMVPALVSNCGTGLDRPAQSPTWRVQMEMKIVRPDAQASKKALRRGFDRSDLVLFRRGPGPVRLIRERNGTLDVIASVPLADVEAAVEIKAACSADPWMRHLFRLDVLKLKNLQDHQPALEAHFVLVDKSLPVGVHAPAFGPDADPDWERGRPGGAWVRRRHAVTFEPSPQLDLHDDGAGVHVWDLVAGPDGPEVRHRIWRGEAKLPTEAEARPLGIIRKARQPDVDDA